jgi:hypothetical protein
MLGYPDGWDVTWLAADVEGRVGAFVTGGEGPIPAALYLWACLEGAMVIETWPTAAGGQGLMVISGQDLEGIESLYATVVRLASGGSSTMDSHPCPIATVVMNQAAT